MGNHEEEFDETEAEVNRTLFIRNIPESTTEDELYELFLQVLIELIEVESHLRLITERMNELIFEFQGIINNHHNNALNLN